MSRGSIICDESSQRIFANRQSLHPDYQEPETGHRVSFQIETEKNRAVARDVERVNPGYKNNDSAVITLTDWDWSKNGGYGMDVSNEGQPVFVLGQFLADQTRTPRAGDRLDAEGVRALARARLDGVRAPKRVLVVDALPLRGPGKVDRRSVAALLARA